MRIGRQPRLPDPGHSLEGAAERWTADRLRLRPAALLRWRRGGGGSETDYPIGIIEVTVGPDGKGEGKIYGMIQASFKDGELDLSSYSGGRPQLVTNVLLTPGK